MVLTTPSTPQKPPRGTAPKRYFRVVVAPADADAEKGRAEVGLQNVVVATDDVDVVVEEKLAGEAQARSQVFGNLVAAEVEGVERQRDAALRCDPVDARTARRFDEATAQ